jgi:predicted nucleotide-binding protein (sugar kinase/HSP70/actin superfamily)
MRSQHALMTVKEFADTVRQHEKSVYRRISAGTQPGVVRVGRPIRIDASVALGGSMDASPSA